MSRCFERVSRVEIEPNEPHAYAKNRWTLNRLSLGILKNFARVSFRFIDVENLQHRENTSIHRISCGTSTLILPPQIYNTAQGRKFNTIKGPMATNNPTKK